jgi:Ala-tRNA(Pro) deacylase
MSIPLRLASYLEQQGARYEVCPHDRSRSSAETARRAHVPEHELAKPVVVEDDAGCLLAVVPADRMVKLGELSRLLGRPYLRLADEDRVAALFTGCEPGAVPTLGMAWGIETVIDDEVEDCPVVYLESGDHEHLVRLMHDEFHALVRPALHGHFCGAGPRH